LDALKLRKIVSVLGLLVPISFVTSYAILFTKIPLIGTIDYLSFFGYNIEGISSQSLVIYFNYLTVGLFIIFFAIGLLLLLYKSFSHNLGALCLLLAGMCWTTLAFLPISQEDANFSDLMLAIILGILISSSFGQIVISSDITSLIKNKIVKRLLLVGGFFTILECVLCIAISNFFITIPVFSILILVFNIGVLGYQLSKDYDIIDRE